MGRLGRRYDPDSIVLASYSLIPRSPCNCGELDEVFTAVASMLDEVFTAVASIPLPRCKETQIFSDTEGLPFETSTFR